MTTLFNAHDPHLCLQWLIMISFLSFVSKAHLSTSQRFFSRLGLD